MFCKRYDNSRKKASSRHRKDKWIEIKPHYRKVSISQKQCQKQRKKGTMKESETSEQTSNKSLPITD